MSFPQSLAPLCSHTPPASHPRPLCYRTHTRTHTRTHVPTLPRCFHLHVPSSSQLPRVPKRTNASKHPLPKSHPLLFFLTCVVFVSPQPKLSKNVVYKFLPSPHVPTHQVRKQQKIPTQHEKHAMICPSVEEARIWENLLKEAVSSSNDRSDPKKKAPTCLPACLPACTNVLHYRRRRSREFCSSLARFRSRCDISRIALESQLGNRTSPRFCWPGCTRLYQVVY